MNKFLAAMILPAMIASAPNVWAMGADGQADPVEPRFDTSQFQKSRTVHAACASDIDRFCARVIPGDRRVRNCLSAKDAELSRGCASGLKRAGNAFSL